MSPELRVRVHPGARRRAIAGRLADGTWKLSVTEPPEGGRANRAVEELLAAALGLARAQVQVVRGGAGRLKVVEVRGLAAEEMTRRLSAAQGTNGGRDGE